MAGKRLDVAETPVARWRLLLNPPVDREVIISDLNGDELLETKGWEDFQYKGLKRLIVSRWLPEHPEYSYVVVK